ncbi:MAG: hypothetical protein R3E97_05965 [Candidatus Eisenbacteria bacterium]
MKHENEATKKRTSAKRANAKKASARRVSAGEASERPTSARSASARPVSAKTRLAELDALRYDFSSQATERRIALFRSFERDRVPLASELLQLHERLCFSLAFPENEEVRTVASSLLSSFATRADLKRHRKALADTGVAGTSIDFRFYWLTAIWLVRQGWGKHLSIVWKEFENAEKLNGLWHLLLPFSETPALDSFAYRAKDWVERLKNPDETDAEFVIRRFDALQVPEPVKEKLYEELDIPMILSAGPETPSRTRDGWPTPVAFRKSAPDSRRPRLHEVVRSTKLDVRPVRPEEGRRLIDLANSCMVPRHRDLLIFLGADENDVRMVDAGDGLQFACMGAVPERRLLLESVYGFLTLMNGVPIGYVLNSALYESAEVAYNVFETYRGRGAAFVYSKILAMVHQLFGATSFAVDPYQLGHGNQEGQLSGAWWFYYKLGFRPHDPEIKALVREELATIRKKPGYRTPPGRIDELAADYMYLQLGPSRPGRSGGRAGSGSRGRGAGGARGAREDVLGHLPLGDIGMKATEYLASRFGADRERGVRTCARESADLLGLRRGVSALPPGERVAWERWAPLVLARPGVERWSRQERAHLAAVVRAKGGRRESDFVALFDRHRKLRKALLS